MVWYYFDDVFLYFSKTNPKYSQAISFTDNIHTVCICFLYVCESVINKSDYNPIFVNLFLTNMTTVLTVWISCLKSTSIQCIYSFWLLTGIKGSTYKQTVVNILPKGR